MEEGNLYRLIDYSNSYIAVKEGMSVYWDLPRLGRCKFNNKVQLLARVCGVPVGRRAGGHFGFLRFSQKKWSNKETYFPKVGRRVK